MPGRSPVRIVISILRLAICMMLVPVCSYSQGFRILSPENGLSNSTTFSVQQDAKGFMWFSTKEGLDRYDGITCKHYDLYDSKNLTRYTLRQNSFYLDSHNELWVVGFADIFRYNQQLDRWETIYSVGKNNSIRTLWVQDTTDLYLGTDQGLIRYNITSRQQTRYPLITAPMINIEAYDASLLMLTFKKGIAFFDYKKQLLNTNLLHPQLKTKLDNLQLTCSAIDSNKQIFLGTAGAVYKCDLKNASLQTTPAFNKQLYQYPVSKILPDKNTTLYIGTEGTGVFKTDTAFTVLESFIANRDDPHSLPENYATDLFIDKDARLWISGKNISFNDPARLKFTIYQHQLNKEGSLIHNSVRSVTEAADGNIWIGTNYGISILNRHNNTWKHINTEYPNSRELITNKIFAVSSDGNNIFAGSNQNRIVSINRNLHITELPGIPGGNMYNNITCIYEDGTDLWIGSVPEKLRKLNTLTGAWTVYPISNVLSITKDGSGKIIAGGHTGVSFISTSGEITGFKAAEYGIGSVFCALVDSKKRLWLGSEGQGLIRFDTSMNRQEKYTVNQGLPSNLVYGILEDKSGKLWLSTTNGLACFNPESKHCTSYSVEEGVGIKEFNFGAYAATRNGEMIFGGSNGLLIFTPEEIRETSIRTPLVFTNLKLFNRSVDRADQDAVLSSVLDETPSLSLKHHQNSITIDFMSINYSSHFKTLYKWKLEGMDADWTPYSDKHSAIYTNLKPGKYLFKVKWSSGIIDQIEQERTLAIIISPPFWQTTWAYLLYIIAAIAFIYCSFFIYRIRINNAHAREKIDFFVNVAHDIRTPLSLIQSPLHIAIGKNDAPENTKRLMETAHNNTQRLTRLITQLLDFEQADLKRIKLNAENVVVEEILNQLYKDFLPLTNKHGIRFNIHHDHHATILQLDKDKFDKIIYNLLSNAVKYSKRDGLIEMKTTISGSRFVITISDTGIGIPNEQQKLIFKRYFRAKNVVNSNEPGSGIGLMLTMALVKLHHGTLRFESKENQGTQFTLGFPLQNDPQPATSPTTVPQNNITVSNTTSSRKNRKPVVLIVEDNYELLHHLVDHLSEFYTIYTADNGREALTKTPKIFPDLIVSDVMMPEMDGREFCHEIKKNVETSHIPVILLTALTTTEHKKEGFKMGADSYLEKPFDIELLKIRIDNLLENRKRLIDKFSSSTEQVETEPAAGPQFLEQVNAIMEENLANYDFSVDEFEKSLGLSHSVLYRKFNATMGKTPNDFITQYRLKKSLILLNNGTLNINEVAYAVGFSDPKYFSTVFKKHFGKNASDFLVRKA